MFLAVASTATGKESMVYEGSYSAVLKSVKAANLIELTAQVWSGYDRFFRITLPGIQVPEMTEEAPICQKALAAKALQFSKAYLKRAQKIDVRSIRMEDSTRPDGHAMIVTEAGSLADQLLKKGLARPDTAKADEPWCS